MEKLDILIKEARGLLEEMGKVVASLNSGNIAEPDANTPAMETDTSADDPEANER